MKLNWKILGTVLIVCIAATCCNKPRPTPQKTEVEKPPAPQLKPEEAKALDSVKQLLKEERYADIKPIVSQFPSTSPLHIVSEVVTARHLAEKVQPKPATTEATVSLPIDIGIEKSRLDELQALATKLIDPKVPAEVPTAMLADPDVPTKLMAIGVLAKREDPTAADSILPLLQHQNIAVRAAAAGALAHLGDQRVKSFLQRTIEQAPDELQRRVAEGLQLYLEYRTLEMKSRETNDPVVIRRLGEQQNELFKKMEEHEGYFKQNFEEIIKKVGPAIKSGTYTP